MKRTHNDYAVWCGMQAAADMLPEQMRKPIYELADQYTGAAKDSRRDPDVIHELYGVCMALKAARDAGHRAGFAIRKIDAILEREPSEPTQSSPVAKENEQAIFSPANGTDAEEKRS